MIVAVVGGRDFNNYQLLKDTLDRFEITKIVSGGAIGADSLAEKYAKEKNIETLIIKPDWVKFGRSAGMVRNTDIVNNSEIIIAFWNGSSKGTSDTITKAKKINKKTIIINY